MAPQEEHSFAGGSNEVRRIMKSKKFYSKRNVFQSLSPSLRRAQGYSKTQSFPLGTNRSRLSGLLEKHRIWNWSESLRTVPSQPLLRWNKPGMLCWGYRSSASPRPPLYHLQLQHSRVRGCHASPWPWLPRAGTGVCLPAASHFSLQGKSNGTSVSGSRGS